MRGPLEVLFALAAIGYILGGISVGGIELGTSGVLLAALCFGHLGYEIPPVVRDLGLALFVGAVGLTAGPRFFKNLKRNAMSYGIIALVIVASGALATALLSKVFSVPRPLAAGIYTGALTTTPGLAAALEVARDDAVSIGYGIAYPFGVVGVVLFVQALPRLLGRDLREELARPSADEPALEVRDLAHAVGPSVGLDRLQELVGLKKPALDKTGGMLTLMAVLAVGTVLARIKFMVPGIGAISLGLSGGPLMVGLVVGHFGGIGPWSLRPSGHLLSVMREAGLMLFLAGAGVAAGHGFVETVARYGLVLFAGGALVTLIPMCFGFVLAAYILKLSLPDTLGAICGGMTSTPALGALIDTAGSDEVAAPYAATYPFALVLVVLASQALASLL